MPKSNGQIAETRNNYTLPVHWAEHCIIEDESLKCTFSVDLVTVLIDWIIITTLCTLSN